MVLRTGDFVPSENVTKIWMFSATSLPNRENIELKTYFCVGVSQTRDAGATKQMASILLTPGVAENIFFRLIDL